MNQPPHDIQQSTCHVGRDADVLDIELRGEDARVAREGGEASGIVGEGAFDGPDVGSPAIEHLRT